jgi:stage II sporulation protein M
LVKKINLYPHLLIAIVAFGLFIFLGTRLPPDLATETISVLQDSLNPLESIGVLPLLLFIFLNNAIKCLLAIVMGVFLGLPPLLFLCFNGIAVGLLSSALVPEVGLSVIIASLAPHGIIEIPILIFTSALGLSIGAETLKFLTRQGSMTKIQLFYGLRLYFKWVLIGLLLASLVEVFVTPQVISWAGGGSISVMTP